MDVYFVVVLRVVEGKCNEISIAVGDRALEDHVCGEKWRKWLDSANIAQLLVSIVYFDETVHTGCQVFDVLVRFGRNS